MQIFTKILTFNFLIFFGIICQNVLSQTFRSHKLLNFMKKVPPPPKTTKRTPPPPAPKIQLPGTQPKITSQNQTFQAPIQEHKNSQPEISNDTSKQQMANTSLQRGTQQLAALSSAQIKEQQRKILNANQQAQNINKQQQQPTQVSPQSNIQKTKLHAPPVSKKNTVVPLKPNKKSNSKLPPLKEINKKSQGAISADFQPITHQENKVYKISPKQLFQSSKKIQQTLISESFPSKQQTKLQEIFDVKSHSEKQQSQKISAPTAQAVIDNSESTSNSIYKRLQNKLKNLSNAREKLQLSGSDQQNQQVMSQPNLGNNQVEDPIQQRTFQIDSYRQVQVSKNQQFVQQQSDMISTIVKRPSQIITEKNLQDSTRSKQQIAQMKNALERNIVVRRSQSIQNKLIIQQSNISLSQTVKKQTLIQKVQYKSQIKRQQNEQNQPVEINQLGKQWKAIMEGMLKTLKSCRKRHLEAQQRFISQQSQFLIAQQNSQQKIAQLMKDLQQQDTKIKKLLAVL